MANLYGTPISPEVIKLQRELNNIYMLWDDANNCFRVRRRVWWKPWTWFRKTVVLRAERPDSEREGQDG